MGSSLVLSACGCFFGEACAAVVFPGFGVVARVLGFFLLSFALVARCPVSLGPLYLYSFSSYCGLSAPCANLA